jgi:hypothetical protein
VRFLITGIGRSGTRYAATLLSNAAIACGHEQAFTPETKSVDDGYGRALRFELDGDSSWYAAPFVADLPPDVIVCHQLRHPAHWIGSWCAGRTVETIRFLRRWAGPYEHGPDAAAALWVRWNLGIARALEERDRPWVRYRVEETAAVLRSTLDVPRERMVMTERATPRTVNRRRRSDTRLDDVSPALRAEIRRTWEGFGFRW